MLHRLGWYVTTTELSQQIYRLAGRGGLALSEVFEILNEMARLTKNAQPAQRAPASNKKKLTRREVESIRKLKRETGMSTREIAGIYDINHVTVSRILRGIYHK